MVQAGAAQAWQEDIKAYLAAQLSTEGQSERTKLADALLSASLAGQNAAAFWWEFLSNEEQALAGSQVSTTLELPKGLKPGQRAVSLFQLYKLATRIAPKSNERAYLQLWLGYARHQGCRNPHEARETYKTLKDQNIGGAAESADLYCQWASLEIKADEAERAAAILKKGLKAGAEPASKLKAMEVRVKGMELTGKAETSQAHRYASAQANTQQSLPTSFLPTPAPHVDQRRIRDFTTTSRLEGMSQQDQLGASEATADVSSKAPATVLSKAIAQHGSPKHTPAALMHRQQGRPAHTVPAAPASHSGTSGASGGSGEATVTLQHNPQVATPATGRTDNSASSTSSITSAQAEAETLKLCQHSLAGRAGPGTSQNARPGLDDEPTVVVNRSLGRLTGTSTLSSLRQGPRRLGLGGGAARIVMPKSQPAKAGSSAPEEDRATEPSNSGEKRKADAEAHAALAKRRPSPEPEVGIRHSAHIVTTHSRRPPLQQIASHSDKPSAVPCSVAGPEAAAADSPGPDTQETVQVIKRVEARPMPMKGHPKRQEQQGHRHPVQQVQQDGDETVPLINGGLAAKAMKGRQSIAQFHSRPHTTGSDALSDAPTAELRRPPSTDLASRQASKAAEDPEQTLPLSRTASGNFMAKAGAPARVERPRLIAPPPPFQPSVPHARSDAVHAASERPVMGPPPSRPRQPLSSISGPPAGQSAAPQSATPQHQPQQAAPPQQHAQPQQQQHTHQQGQPQPQQQQHRVRREDENSVVVRGTRYTKLECVGRGGSSKVYKVMAPNRKIYALKRIRLTGRDREAAAGFIDEITLLQRLRGHSNIIQLIDAEVIKSEGLIYMVLEYGDIDLARLLQRHEVTQKEGGHTELDENFIRLYWQQMLQAVHTIHEARIVHSDLKPANFLVVEGQLKLIDFGIAKAISSDTTSIAREAQVGTLNYMSPEAILGGATNIRGGPPMKVGRPSDVWSLGCILYQMVYGHTPFSALQFIQKMHAITDPNHRISMPALRNRALADVIQRCLDRNARTRITMQELLNHPLLRPTAAAAQDSLVGVTKDQLKKLLIQVSTASAGGCPADLDTISEELFKQLSSGQTVNVAGLLKSAARSSAAEAPMKEPVAAKGNILSAAAADRAGPGGNGSRAGAAQNRPTDARPAAFQPSKAASEVAHVGLHDIQAGRAALRRIDAEQIQQRKLPLPKEDSLETRLREGLAKFRFDDTAGSLANGENSGDFTS